MKASAILLQDLDAEARTAGLAALGEPLAGALADADAGLRAHAAWQRQAGQTLALLERLHVDDDTLAAAVRFDAWLAAGPGSNPTWPVEVSAGQRRLLEGQLAAERVWTLHAERSPTSGVEGLRRLLLAIIGDLRVVLILLARQLARLRGAGHLPEAERRALAALCMDIHAPLANRLGIWQLKWELEDLAFSILEPETYRRIARLLDEGRAEREAFIRRCLADLGHALQAAGITADLAGRPKHVYSIWRKMQRKHLEFAELFDIRAVRALVDDIPACYATLGIVHGLWMHIPREFDDYIARPKPNGYQSLHTVVVGPQGKTLEVQIRTRAMHEANELGVASHWRYKEGGGSDPAFEAKVAWMRKLLDARGETETGDDEHDLAAGFRGELLEDRVYLLTPRGDVFDLPAGATVLDFAYHVHTDVGHRCRGAKVNGRIVPLTFQPETGDRIEILTGKVAEPSRDWLSPQAAYLTTPRGREKVRAWFRRSDHAANVAAGQAVLDRELRRAGLIQSGVEDLHVRFRLQTHDELLVALALGEVTPGQVARVLQELHAPPLDAAPPPAPPRTRPSAPALTIEGIGNLLTTLARCCQPVAGDAVCGYVTRGRGVSVHRADCKALARLRQRAPDRVVEVAWGRGGERSYSVDVVVRGHVRKTLLKDVASAIANAGAHIAASSNRTLGQSAEVEMRFTLRVADFGQLSDVLLGVSGVPGVFEARRAASSNGG